MIDTWKKLDDATINCKYGFLSLSKAELKAIAKDIWLGNAGMIPKKDATRKLYAISNGRMDMKLNGVRLWLAYEDIENKVETG